MDIKGNTPGASNAAQVEVPCIVFFALTPIFIGLRIWSRLSKGSKLGADDWTILVSFVSHSREPTADALDTQLMRIQGLRINCADTHDDICSIWLRTACL